MEPGRYEDYAKRLLPKWMRGPWLDKLWTAILWGPIDLIDVDREEAAKAALVEHCPDDAVEVHARERLLEPIVGESIAALRERVKSAWTFWSELGPTAKLQEALRLYTGLPGLRVYDCNTQGDDWLGGYAGLSDGEDANAANWSRHFIVVPKSSHSWERPAVGAGLVVGPGLMVGLTMTQTELSRIRRAYRRHRPAHMVGGDIYVDFEPGNDPDAIAALHDGSADFSRLPLHRQMVGYGPHGMTVGPTLIVGQEFT